MFALFITCRREAPSCLETRRHVSIHKRDEIKKKGKKKGKGKRKKWIFFDESRYKRDGVLVRGSLAVPSSPPPLSICLSLPLSGRERRSVLGEESLGERTFQITSHQRKRAAATARNYVSSHVYFAGETVVSGISERGSRVVR